MAETKLIRDHHLLTRNLKLNGNYLSNDGGDEGISIQDDGDVIINGDTKLYLNDAGGEYLNSDGTDLTIASGDDITLDVGGDVALDASSGYIYFKKDNTNGFTMLLAPGSSSSITANGDLKLIGSDIILDPAAAGSVLADINIANTTAATYKGLHVDYDRTGTVISGTDSNRALHVDISVTGASTTVNTTGIDVDVVGDDAGVFNVTKNTGMDIAVSGADNNYGLNITVPDVAGDYHIKLMAADDVNDYATLHVVDTGDLTIATVGTGTTDSNLTLDADGDITLDAAGGNITLLNAGSTYTPTATSDATTKTYVDTQTVITGNAYNNRVHATTWTIMNNDTAQPLGGTDTTVGDTQDIGTINRLDYQCLMAVIPYNMTVHAISGSVFDDDIDTTSDKHIGLWRLPSLSATSTPASSFVDTFTLAYITSAFAGNIGRVQTFHDTSADFALTAGDGIFMGWLNPQSGGVDDVTLTMTIWAHQTTP